MAVGMRFGGTGHGLRTGVQSKPNAECFLGALYVWYVVGFGLNSGTVTESLDAQKACARAEVPPPLV